MDIVDHKLQHKQMGDVPTKAQALAYARPAGKIVLLGSSIISLGDADISTPYYTSSSPFMNASGYFHRANYRLGCPFTSVTNAGVAGGRATNIYTAFLNTALPANPNWILLEPMRNDCAIDMGSLTIAQIRSAVNNIWTLYIAPILNTCKARGIGIIFQTIQPGAANTGALQDEFAKAAAMVNRRVAEYCYANFGAILFDPSPALLLYTTASDMALHKGDPQYFSVSGVVHQNPLGGQVGGDILYDALKYIIPRGRHALVSMWDGTDGDVDNAVRNGGLFGTAGNTTKPLRVSGPIATNWNVDPFFVDFVGTTVVCDKIAHWNPLYPALRAQSIRVTAQPAHVAEDPYFSANQFVSFYSDNFVIAGSQFAVGDTIYGAIAVDVTENSGTAATTMLHIEANDGASSVYAVAAVNAPMEDTGATVRLNGGKITDGILRSTRPFVIPAGAVNLVMRVLTLTSAGGDVTWKFATPSIFKAQTYT